VVLRDGAVTGDLRQRWIEALYKGGGAGSREGIGGGVNEELRVVKGLRTDTHDTDILIGPGWPQISVTECGSNGGHPIGTDGCEFRGLGQDSRRVLTAHDLRGRRPHALMGRLGLGA
jgi:hypothetical protein